MKIRKTSNILAIKGLFKAIFPVDEWEMPKKSVHWIIYDSEDLPIGFCSCHKLAYENGIFLSLAGLLPCARGKGYHKDLIKTRLKWAKRNGLKFAVTYTARENQSSYDNLQDLGFRLYEPDYKWVGHNFYYWIKKL